MIRFASTLSVLAMMAAVPGAAQESARDFQLPPAPAPTQESRVQGPVDTEGVVPIRPRAIETARPATPAPAPAPATSAAPPLVLPTPSATRAAESPRTPAPAATSPAQREVGSTTPAVAPPLAPLDQPAQPAPAPLSQSAASAPPVQSPLATAPDEAPSLPWMWLGLGLLAAAGAALFLRRRRVEPAAPTILTPLVPTATPPLDPAQALAMSVEAVRMDRSVMNATVNYRVTLRNRTAQALSGLAVEADLVSASADRPAESQLASPGHALTPRHSAERLAPGQSLRFEGQVRLPLAEASAIWQGRVGLLVPLLRVRATAVGAQPVATTLVIGRSAGVAARPQPFRLDEPPRSYAPLAQRVLDAVPAGA